jgi:DNA-nicking Smr family endonuclease
MKNKIDIHGVKHSEVKRKLDVFFWEMMNTNHFEVEVITGISHIMKSIVKESADDYKFTVTDIPLNPGSLIVRIK